MARTGLHIDCNALDTFIEYRWHEKGYSCWYLGDKPPKHRSSVFDVQKRLVGGVTRRVSDWIPASTKAESFVKAHLEDVDVSDETQIGSKKRDANCPDLWTGNGFPKNPSKGDTFVLMSDGAVPQDKLFKCVQQQPTLRSIYLGDGLEHPRYIYAYSPKYDGTGATLLRNKVFAVYGGCRDKIADTLYLTPSRFSWPVATESVSGFPYWFEIKGLIYDCLSPKHHSLNFKNTDGTLMFPDEQKVIGVYTWGGNCWTMNPHMTMCRDDQPTNEGGLYEYRWQIVGSDEWQTGEVVPVGHVHFRRLQRRAYYREMLGYGDWFDVKITPVE